MWVTTLLRYIESWVGGDPERIASTVTDDCVISECWGPIYRSRASVQQWAQAWFGAGGVIHRWEVTDHFRAEEREAAAWTFEYTWQGRHDVIAGASIASSSHGLLSRLSEFRTTAPGYNWAGEWR